MLSFNESNDGPFAKQQGLGSPQPEEEGFWGCDGPISAQDQPWGTAGD